MRSPSGCGAGLFNSDGPMLLFSRPNRQNASILNKREFYQDSIPRDGSRKGPPF